MDKLLGKKKADVVAAAELPEGDQKLPPPAPPSPIDTAASATLHAPPQAAASATASPALASETSAEAKAKTGEEKEELSAELKQEIKTMSESYQAKCMAVQLCVSEYTRRRQEARYNTIAKRIDHIISFIFMTYGLDLCLRYKAVAPNIPEPIAFIVVVERNGSIVNLDETTVVNQTQLDIYMRAEPAESPTMAMYYELQAAFNSNDFNPRRHLVVHILERGKYQDLGVNIRRTFYADFNYKLTESFINSQLIKLAKPGAPRTVDEIHAENLRRDAMARQNDTLNASAPAT
jgi:hypothetical protein